MFATFAGATARQADRNTYYYFIPSNVTIKSEVRRTGKVRRKKEELRSDE
jgi:hypothetical protein